MTIQSTSGTEKTIDEIGLLAYRMAGLLEESQTLADVNGGALARELFGTMLDELQADGVIARAVKFTTVTLVDGTYLYTLDASVIEAFGDAMYIPDGQSVSAGDSELLITPMSRAEWQSISSKSATGQPTRYYCHRESTPAQVYLWPIPDAAATIRFQAHRHLADADTGSATVDLEKWWTPFLIHRLAELLAESKSMPPDKIGRLGGKAGKLKAAAMRMSKPNSDEQLVVEHPTGW